MNIGSLILSEWFIESKKKEIIFPLVRIHLFVSD